MQAKLVSCFIFLSIDRRPSSTLFFSPRIGIAPDYVLVSEQSESKLIEAMKKVMKEFFPSDAQSNKTSTKSDNPGPSDSKFCKIVNQRHFDRLNNYLSQTRGEIIKLDLNSSAQPEMADPTSLRIPLTLIRNVQHDDVLMEEELFGPLLPILTFNNDHEDIVQCLHRINQSAPLALYAFGQSEEKLEFSKQSCNIRQSREKKRNILQLEGHHLISFISPKTY